jgi:hypothetical protein
MSFGDPRAKTSVTWNTLIAHPWVRFAGLTIYYLAILVALFALYGAGDFSTPPFIYQNF